MPDYMEAQVSLRIEPQNLRVNDSDSETLQETFSVKTADIGFRERLNQNSLDSVSELLSFLNRRLYSPGEFLPNQVSPPAQPDDDFVEPEEYETEDIVDPKFEIERIATLYYQRTRTMMRRMTKKLTSLSAADKRLQLAAIRQLAVVLGVLHWFRQLEKSEKFSLSETELVSIEDEWKLFVAATVFVSSIKSRPGANEEVPTQSYSEVLSMVTGYLVWLGYDCGFDILKFDELRNHNYGEERSDGWTNEEVLEVTACFLKLAVHLSGDDQARKILDKALETEESTDLIERNTAWMNKINQTSKNLSSILTHNRKARIGDLVYLTKMKEKEILVASGDSGSIKVIMLNAENRCKKFSSDTVAVINL